MLIKLVQRDCNGKEKTVDIAGSIESLDFSDLRGSLPWEVRVVWDDREDRIAHVVWEVSEAYQVWEDPSNLSRGSSPTQVTFRQDCIVPDVKRRLGRLFQLGLIDQMYRQQPCVTVAPLG